jgi:hypothetical protein
LGLPHFAFSKPLLMIPTYTSTLVFNFILQGIFVLTLILLIRINHMLLQNKFLKSLH